MRIALLLRMLKRHVNGWTVTSMIGAAVILLPILYLLLSLFLPPNDNWSTVKQFLLTDYVLGSARLVLMTAFFAVCIGAAFAWLVVGYTFPLRNVFKWALALPLAMPPYIAAYTYSTMTGYTGIIQATLRNRFGIVLPPGIIEVMSERGAVFVLTLFLFPYVFMITRAFLERQSASYIENARLLGHRPLSVFIRVVLPLARPAIMAGGMLVVFEVLSDYGVANYFGVQTISTAIFQTWFGMYDMASAMRLAAWLMVGVISLFILEHWLRRNRRYSDTTSQTHPLKPKALKGAAAWVVCMSCGLLLLLAFLAPFVQLIAWSVQYGAKIWRSDFAELALNTLQGAGIATALILLVALLSSRAVRMIDSPFMQALARLISAGYSVPGAIIAIGVLAVFTVLDGWLSPLYGSLGLGEGSLVLSLSLAMLLTGYVIRYMATGYSALESGYEKIPRAYSEASRTLGRSSLVTFIRVELPLLKGSLLSGFVLTFVEIIKELPLTLLLRPFNYDTLSTRAYQYATDERVFEAALPSLLLVLIGLVTVLFILNPERRSI